MKVIFVCFISLLSSTICYADAANDIKVKNCLQKWGTHPFNQDLPKYRVLESSTTVLGIGSGGVDDHSSTKEPDLVLVKSAPGFLSNIKHRLMNPNGWYCVDSAVNIMGNKSTEIDCRANFAQSQSSFVFKGDGNENLQVSDSGQLDLINCKSLPINNRFFSIHVPTYTTAFTFGFGSTYFTNPTNLSGNDGHQSFSWGLDFGYFFYFHTAMRYTADYKMVDTQAPVTSERNFRIFSADFGFRGILPYRYFQPFVGYGTILGTTHISNPNYSSSISGSFNSESRFTQGEYLELGLLVPTVGRQKRLTFVFNYRNERYRTASSGDYGNFGFRSEKLEIGIAMQGYDISEIGKLNSALIH